MHNRRHLIAATVISGGIIAAAYAGHADATGPIWCQKHPTVPHCVDHASTTTTVPTSTSVPPVTTSPPSTTVPMPPTTTGVPASPPQTPGTPTIGIQRQLPATGGGDSPLLLLGVTFVGLGTLVLVVRRRSAS